MTMPALPQLAPYFLFGSVAVAFVAAALKWREDKKLKEQEDRFQKTLQAIPESWFENKGDAV